MTNVCSFLAVNTPQVSNKSWQKAKQGWWCTSAACCDWSPDGGARAQRAVVGHRHGGARAQRAVIGHRHGGARAQRAVIGHPAVVHEHSVL